MRLPNGEIIYTDPLNSDTDGDGLKDGEEIVPQFNFVNSSWVGLPNISLGIFFNMRSDSTMKDTDEDGILDNDDRWNDGIWDRNNPADLRYMSLSPLIRNTLQTLYSDINEHNNPDNANYITIENNTIKINSCVLFTGNAYDCFPNNDYTYAELIEDAIESRWITELYGSDYDFVKGMKINIVTDVMPIEALPLGYSRQYITIDVINYKDGIPNTSLPFYQPYWSTSNVGKITMYKKDERKMAEYNYLTYQSTVAHEFGHTIGLADAYFENDYGKKLLCNAEVDPGVFWGFDGNIMYHNGIVYANDIEMVLEAYVNNCYQYYLDRNTNKYFPIFSQKQSKSNVIRLPQKFGIVE